MYINNIKKKRISKQDNKKNMEIIASNKSHVDVQINNMDKTQSWLGQWVIFKAIQQLGSRCWGCQYV